MVFGKLRYAQSEKYVLALRVGALPTQLFDELEESSCHHVVFR